MFDDTITWFHFNGEKYERLVMHCVQLKKSVSETVSSNGKITYHPTFSITLPYYNDFPFTPETDFVFEGTLHKTMTPSNARDLLNEYHGLTIKAVADNRNREHLKHWRLTCQ